VLTGTGFIIGGIWVPPLFAVGGVILASSLGFFQGAFSKGCTSTPNQEPETPREPDVVPPAPPNTPEPTNSVSLHWHTTERYILSHYTSEGVELTGDTANSVKPKSLTLQ